jgi:hypothetical protein
MTICEVNSFKKGLNMDTLAAYILLFMQSAVAMTDHSYYEPLTKTQARYESIANDIAIVAKESPLFQDDAEGIKTGLFITTVASTEGFFREDVDTCKRGGDKDKDGNPTAWTLWQMHLKKDVVCHDRLTAARYAREMIRFSLKTCESYPFLDRLAVYTDGHCATNWNRSRFRIKRAMDWFNNHPFQKEE